MDGVIEFDLDRQEESYNLSISDKPSSRWATMNKFRATARMDIYSREELLDVLNRAKVYSPKEAALIALMYLTGARVGEVIHVRKKDIKYEEVIYDSDLGEYCGDGKLMVIIHLITEKRRKRVWRNIPVYVDLDLPFLEYLMPYIDALNEPNDKPFFMHTNTVRKIINKWFTFENETSYPHLFRHTRVTHLLTGYNTITGKRFRGLSETAVRRMMGWKDKRPLSVYEHTTYNDIMHEMINYGR